MVFGASLTPVAADHFHYLGDERHADLTPAFRRVMQDVAKLPCDILISAHPDHSGADQKLAQLVMGTHRIPLSMRRRAAAMRPKMRPSWTRA